MKVTARKTVQGYLVSNERCDTCEMHLMSINGNFTCKVCPAIEKWVQRKTEVEVRSHIDGVYARVNTGEKDSENHDHYPVEENYSSNPVKSTYRMESDNADGYNKPPAFKSRIVFAAGETADIDQDKGEKDDTRLEGSRDCILHDFQSVVTQDVVGSSNVIIAQEETTEQPNSNSSLIGAGKDMPTFRIR